MKTVDIEFYKLCNEIDYWEERAEYWEKEYRKMRKKYADLLSESINHNRIMTANILKAYLSKDEE
jgi:hypothetical protein